MSWGLANLRDGDEILFSPVGHASNVYPWVHLRQLLARFGTTIALVPVAVTATGAADPADILAKVSPRTRLIVATHIHNGSMTTLAELSGKIDESVRLCFDCSQSVGHVPVDVTRLGADFAASSGHKMFGVPGTGVLYASRRVIACDRLEPYLSYIRQRRPELFGQTRGVTPRDPPARALAAAEISVAELASLGADAPVLCVDTRGSMAYRIGHVPGSVKIRDDHLENMLRQGFPFPSSRKIVLICPIGEYSTRLAASLTQVGHDAASLAGGIVAWRDAGLPLESSLAHGNASAGP